MSCLHCVWALCLMWWNTGVRHVLENTNRELKVLFGVFCLILFKQIRNPQLFYRQITLAWCHKEIWHEDNWRDTWKTWSSFRQSRILLEWRSSVFFFFPVCGLIKSRSFCWPPSCTFMDLQDFNTRARNLLSQCRQLVSGCSHICRLLAQWRSRWTLWWEERTNSVSHIFGLKFVPQMVKWREDDAQAIWWGITYENNKLLLCKM